MVIKFDKFFKKEQNVIFLVAFLFLFSYFLSLVIPVPGPMYSPGSAVTREDGAVFIFAMVILTFSLALFYRLLRLDILT